MGLRVKIEAFFVDHGLKKFFGGFEVVPAPVKRLLADDFLFFFVEAFEVGVGEAVFDCVPLVGVEGEHFGEQVGSCGLDVGEQFFPALFGPFRKGFDVLDGVFVSFVK